MTATTGDRLLHFPNSKDFIEATPELCEWNQCRPRRCADPADEEKHAGGTPLSASDSCYFAKSAQGRVPRTRAASGTKTRPSSAFIGAVHVN
jgi:hypothetical protein